VEHNFTRVKTMDRPFECYAVGYKLPITSISDSSE